MKILLLLFFCFSFCIGAYGQDSLEIKHNLKPGILEMHDVELLYSIEFLEDEDKKFQIITDLLDSDSTAWKIKICLLGEYLKEENTYNTIFSDWVLRNIGLKISLDPIKHSMVMRTYQYPVVYFIVSLENPHFVTPEDVLRSDLFKKCKLFEQQYEKYFLKFLMVEYFLMNNVDFTELDIMSDDPCVTENLDEIKLLCPKR
jgi:hypothetical protein